MAEEKGRKYDGKFKERAVALARERQNVAQAAWELPNPVNLTARSGSI